MVGASLLLEEEEDMEVVGFGGNAKDALVLARDLLPDLILMDLDMPGSGLTAASEIALAANNRWWILQTRTEVYYDA